jgi:hypothetical protein
MNYRHIYAAAGAALLAVCALLPSTLDAQSHRFVALYAETGGICADVRMHQEDLADRREYSAKSNSFRRAHRHTDGTHLFSPGEAALVYEYDTRMEGFGCTKKVIGIARGPDVAAARREIDAHVSRNSRRFVTQPRIVLTWDRGAVVERITRDYQGVEVVYSAVTQRSGSTTVLAQGRNQRQDLAAVIRFRRNGGSSDEVVLQPGESFSRSFPSMESLDVEVRFQAPRQGDGRSLSEQADRLLRQIIEDHMTTKGGNLYNPTGWGIRG